jgi:ornithine cyclodeaminase/alanine dehydrogenase-like protein (mu-crystallin family)
MAIFLRESDVERLATMEMALEAVEQAFRFQGEQKASNAPRRRSVLEKGFLHVMSASLPTINIAGIKSYTSVAGKNRFHVLLYDGQDGRLLAVMEADKLGQLRTGATSGIATKYMAKPDAASVGVFGTGWQARTQLEAIRVVRPVKNAIVYGRDKDRREGFCKEMSQKLGIPVCPASKPEEAVREMEIVVTATTSKEPVFQGEWLQPGTHINAVGANFPQRRELDLETIRRSACVVVDSIEQSQIESGDLAHAAEQGVFFWEDARELGLVVVGDFPGREDAGEITLFKSHGIALEDVALAGRIYQAALENKIGEPLPF